MGPPPPPPTGVEVGYLWVGVVVGVVASRWVVQVVEHVWFMVRYCGTTGREFDEIYAKMNLKSVLKRNAKVESCWMNLGLVKGEEWTSYPEAAANLARELGKKADLGSRTRVLDVGFGYGDQDMLWAREYPKLEIRGLNIGEEQVRVARMRVQGAGLASRVDLGVGSATEFPDDCRNSFDAVLSLESAFHYDTREVFFRQAFTALKPGGVLAVADILREHGTPKPTLDRSFFFAPFSFLANYLIVRRSVPDANKYDIHRLEAILRDVGFVDFHAQDVSQDVLIFRNQRSISSPFSKSLYPLRHFSRLWPSALERLLLGSSAPSVVGGDDFNLYCFPTTNASGFKYFLYTASKPHTTWF